jgi:hypothetical protein
MEAAAVAAACAMIAGWILMVGQVTPVPTLNRSVSRAMPPSTVQTKGLSPWRLTHGW